MKNAELKNKHNHALTQWLKVGIFSLLMLAPLIASVSQWIYAICNKNAKDSYGGFNENQVEYVEPTNVEIYEQYNLVNHPFTLSFGYININTLSVNEFSGNQQTKELIETTTRIYFRDNGTDYIFYANDNYLTEINVNNTTLDMTIVITSSNYANLNDLKPLLLTKIVNGNETLDNAFYYGVEKMTKSDLFNWTQNTALYTGIKGMTDNLEIGTPAIAILITYWTILTIAYVIIDILITGFTWITHLIVRNK